MKSDRKNETKKRSLVGRNIKSMIFLGLFLIIGTCAMAGQMLYKRNIAIYTEYTYSYAQLIADNISGIIPTKYLETETKDEDYYGIRYALMTAGINETAFRDLYLVIPTEDDLIYISEIYHNLPEGEESLSKEQAGFLEHKAYHPGEKDVMMSILEDAKDGVQNQKLYLGIRKINEESLATALVPIHAMENEVPALIGLDISVGAVWQALMNLFVMLFITIVVITSIGIFFHYRILERTLIKPLTSLKRGTDALISNLESDIPFHAEVHTGDELEVLAHSIEEMDRNLKHYIQENTAITAEKERISTELELARRIQANMLPNIFPPFPTRNEIDIYAVMDPAKEVGGDFYDFFLIDQDHLGLVIADVSGKGIPAALFMMMVKIMLQNCTLAGLNPKQTMEQVNRLVCENNSESMFVTIWLGIFDLQSGIITAVNAGHEYPILKKPDGFYELIQDRHGLAVGMMDGISYREYEFHMEPGSSLFVYTDGLPEANDSRNRFFGMDRTLRALNEAGSTDPEKVLQYVRSSVDAFVGEAPQYDDLTMMCITYHGADTLNELSEESERKEERSDETGSK